MKHCHNFSRLKKVLISTCWCKEGRTFQRLRHFWLFIEKANAWSSVVTLGRNSLESQVTQSIVSSLIGCWQLVTMNQSCSIRASVSKGTVSFIGEPFLPATG
eukprot:Protomagalhaensia_wolfi_Nauph_80__1505@NODE_1913_length_1281_cov_12_770531_g1497_i0_p4_GENE_NODE_1913_length_1281_cov_12_770531_g1497_i0NODE_1913_length_1281_cov_12_770531_g1497_i0_p4_ORF_typecomplete_len102_score1_43OpgC_C/PF10129_9/0_11_NODE_1913_length_1281_cov_12_770531_g1497_i0625930